MYRIAFSSILDEIVRECSPSSWVRLGSIFGLRFSVDFSPLFGLRRVREMPVSRDFPSSGVDLWTVFGPFLDLFSAVHLPRMGLLSLRRG